MTLISMSAGRVIMRDGKIATEQECCCCPCYVQSEPFIASSCPLPEFFAVNCGALQQAFINFKTDLEAAGYTVNLRALDAAEIPCDPGCGYEVTFSCDTCAPEWNEPFFPNPNPTPEKFCLLDGDYGNVDFSAVVVSLPCHSPGLVTELINFNGYIPCCGNPLP